MNKQRENQCNFFSQHFQFLHRLLFPNKLCFMEFLLFDQPSCSTKVRIFQGQNSTEMRRVILFSPNTRTFRGRNEEERGQRADLLLRRIPNDFSLSPPPKNMYYYYAVCRSSKMMLVPSWCSVLTIKGLLRAGKFGFGWVDIGYLELID